MLQIKLILVPVDFSDFSAQAMEYAMELADRFGARLRLLHVVETAVIAMPSVGAPAATELVSETEEEAAERLLTLAEAVAQRGIEVEQEVISDAPPPDAIVRAAKDDGADVIVMATHGRTGLGRVLLGSVTEHVVRSADCAVLTIRARAGD